MQVKSIAECSKGEHSAILLPFIKLPFVIKIFILSIFECIFYFSDHYQILPSGNLQIINISTKDQGHYQCMAHNALRNRTRTSNHLIHLQVLNTVGEYFLGSSSWFFVVCWFFSKSTFSKILWGISSECQTVWIQIRPDVLSGLISDLSGLIWFQTVCKFISRRH